jgi:hypothetical protein
VELTMSAREFKSLQRPPTEGEIVAIARQLLEEHAASRKAATDANNLVCGNCQGSGNAFSDIAQQITRCWACEGTGQPNDKITSLPALEHADHERIWKLGQLLQGPHRVAVLAIVREFMPDLFKSEGAVN